MRDIFSIDDLNILFEIILARVLFKKCSWDTWDFKTYWVDWGLIIKNCVDFYHFKRRLNILNSLKDNKYIEYNENIFHKKLFDKIKSSLAFLKLKVISAI